MIAHNSSWASICANVEYHDHEVLHGYRAYVLVCLYSGLYTFLQPPNVFSLSFLFFGLAKFVLSSYLRSYFSASLNKSRHAAPISMPTSSRSDIWLASEWLFILCLNDIINRERYCRGCASLQELTLLIHLNKKLTHLQCIIRNLFRLHCTGKLSENV